MRASALDTSRGLACAGVLLFAIVHLDLWEQGFRDIHTIGQLFLLDAIAGLVIGVAVLARRHWLPAVAALDFGVAALPWRAMRERTASARPWPARVIPTCCARDGHAR